MIYSTLFSVNYSFFCVGFFVFRVFINVIYRLSVKRKLKKEKNGLQAGWKTGKGDLKWVCLRYELKLRYNFG